MHIAEVVPLPIVAIPHAELSRTTIRKDWLEAIFLRKEFSKALPLDRRGVEFLTAEGVDLDSGDTLWAFELITPALGFELVRHMIPYCTSLEPDDLGPLVWKGDVARIRDLYTQIRTLERSVRRMRRSNLYSGSDVTLRGELLVLGAVGNLCQAALAGDSYKIDDVKKRRLALHMSKAAWQLVGLTGNKTEAVRTLWTQLIEALKASRAV